MRGTAAAAVAALALAAPVPAEGTGGGPPQPVRPGAVVALVLPVAGMTCALCTRGVEESIKRLDGIGGAAADLKSGRVRVQAAEGKSLDIHDVKDRVLKAGFRVEGECEVEAIGRFTIGPDGRITFKIPGTLYGFQVLEGSELKRLFKVSPGLKGEFFLAFRLHDHPRFRPPAISIERGEPHLPAVSVAGG